MKKYITRKIFLLNEARKSKTIVFILSSMRSGSTLLKSLLANAPDTSHLPEHDFQKYTSKNAWKMKTLSKAPIIILKKPASFGDVHYPRIPAIRHSKTIVLFRDAYETITSLKAMNQRAYPELDLTWNYDRLLHEYWYPVYQKLATYTQQSDVDVQVVRYEDLLQNPIAVTEKLFRFIGSKQKTGIDSYAPPKSYDWAWGNDDGGQKIKTFKVQNASSERDNQILLDLIEQSESVQSLRKWLAYI